MSSQTCAQRDRERQTETDRPTDRLSYMLRVSVRWYTERVTRVVPSMCVVAAELVQFPPSCVVSVVSVVTQSSRRWSATLTSFCRLR